MSQKTLSRFKARIRWLTARRRSKTFASVLEQVNWLIVGWGNYFALARAGRKFQDLDKWIRRRLRAFKLFQLKRTYTVWKFYRQYGISEKQAWLAALSGKGIWRKSKTPQANGAMDLRWFQELGLRSLRKGWEAIGARRNRLGAEQACRVV